MSLKSAPFAVLAALCSLALLAAQGRLPVRGTFDDRLRAIEERIEAVEDRLARADEEQAAPPAPRTDRLSLESDLKLDRMEVRLIQLEKRSADCDCESVGQRSVLDRLRSVERQVARLRAAGVR